MRQKAILLYTVTESTKSHGKWLQTIINKIKYVSIMKLSQKTETCTQSDTY